MIASNVKTHPRKGIGKTKDSVKPISEVLNISITDSPSIETIPTFPHLETINTLEKLPRYSIVLNRTEEEGVCTEDLDALQLELETLLSAVVVRSRVLQKEISVFSSAEEKHKKKEELKAKLSHSTGKQANIQSKPVKKIKEIPNKLRGGLDETPVAAKVTKVKNSSILQHEHKSKPVEEIKAEIPQLPQRRYEPPNKFWTSVNPFCSDITLQDIKFLEELIKKYDNNQDLLNIPFLGRHYSERWAKEELMNEQCASHFEGKIKAKRSVTTMESDRLLKRAENSSEGPRAKSLTQRLISALAEENIKVPENERKLNDKCTGGEKMTNQFSSFAGSNLSSFERRVRKALEDEDILDYSDRPMGIIDEILQEIRNCQAELGVINNFNVQNLKRLLKLAKTEVARQELRRKLEVADNEVLENYKTVLAAKQKKMPLSRNVQERCWKALKDRDELRKQIDSL